MTGGSGADSLTGGSGADRFIFSATLALNGNDTITDFTIDSGNDVIDFFGDTAAVYSATTLNSGDVSVGVNQVIKYTGNQTIQVGNGGRVFSGNDNTGTNFFEVQNGADSIILRGTANSATSFEVYRVYDSDSSGTIAAAVELIGTVTIAGGGTYQGLVTGNVT